MINRACDQQEGLDRSKLGFVKRTLLADDCDEKGRKTTDTDGNGHKRGRSGMKCRKKR